MILIDDLEIKIDVVSHAKNVSLNKNICGLEEDNTQLSDKVSHLQASVDEIHEEYAPLQEDNKHLFGAYEALKQDYDVFLSQLIEKDEIVKNFQDWKKRLELNIN